MMRHIYIAVLASSLFLTACGSSSHNKKPTAAETTVTTPVTTTIPATTTTAATTTTTTTTTTTAAETTNISDYEKEYELEDDSSQSDDSAEIVFPGVLSSADDIGLYDTDGSGTTYCFTCGGEEYTAVYTPDNWKIIDSYRLSNYSDMIIICTALSEIHPIHSADYQSYRTPQDMAYEWLQHSIAYRLLDDTSDWKTRAKDVDLDPEDQGGVKIES